MEEYIARVDDKGNIKWLQDGRYHHLNGPAVEYVDGYKEWYRDDKLDRLDGPAINNVDGYRAWYINGKEYTCEEFLEMTKPKVRELTLVEVSVLLGYEIKIVE
jgi:hypothetical protein